MHLYLYISLSSDDLNLKEAAPGCVDQKLSEFSASEDGILRHEELPIPQTADIPYALEVLLERFRQQYMNMLRQFKDEKYRASIDIAVREEKVRI